ncbi:hypothetical protein Desku_1592 [Desulfofundulus kuznetsovii DSM 6115]|uniref:Uncharacterized protein n=1 Tax=Desulfofundulus kuznetsovii (strain DSM 6115 / VKM B-1805 / 17) TaxID=760568 RepID=A0AAU8PHI9_DESK7|nr:hypothetical protein Desku_1592 [Desulfofundulus kuznetsovii DSM 6115]
MVLCDPKKIEPGVICSGKALAVLEFLESCGGAPEPAVALLFPRHCRKSLRILRGSGYTRRCWTPGQDPFWCPVTFPAPRTGEEYVVRCALGWLAARLVEAGGRLEGRQAVLPTGRTYRACVWPGRIPDGPVLVVSMTGEKPESGDLWAEYECLKERGLRECLKKVQ